MTQPGRRLRIFAARVCDAQTMERVIDPAIADLRIEASDAWEQGPVWKAWFIMLAGYAGLGKVCALIFSHEVFRMFAHGNPDHNAAVRRAVLIFVAVTGVVTFALAAPHYYLYETAGRAWRVLYVMPSVLPLSVAVGVAAAVIGAFANRPVTRSIAVVVLASAFVCSMMVFADLAWITPDANQAYRESVFGGPLARGDHEMVMSDLARQMVVRPDEVRRFEITYHMRWSLSAAPLALAGLALAVLRWRRRTKRVLTVAGIFLGYYALLMVAQYAAVWSMLPVMLVLWFPNVAYAVLATAFAWRGQAVSSVPIS